ncbi:MAG TPA: glycosyltransferase family 9 protein [bacterium]|nr:glycosyltransferase family 9 protein [bacterium]
MERPQALVLAAGSLGDCILTLPALQVLEKLTQVTVAGTSPYLQLGSLLGPHLSAVPLEPLLQKLYAGQDLVPSFPSGCRDLFLFFKDQDPRLMAVLKGQTDIRVHSPSKSFEEFLKEGRWAGDFWLETVLGPGRPIDEKMRDGRFKLPPEFYERGLQVCRTLGVPAAALKGPFVIHPGSGSRQKNAPLSFFREAAQKISSETDKEILVLWGEAEQDWVGEIRQAFQDIPRVTVLREPLPLPDAAAALAVSCGYMGNDSGITHLASACGAKTFALFNSTDAKVWGPQANFIILSALKGSLA